MGMVIERYLKKRKRKIYIYIHIYNVIYIRVKNVQHLNF